MHMEKPVWDSEEPMEGNPVEFNIPQTLWGLACVSQLGWALAIYSWYPHWIENNNIKFPDSDPTGDNLDEEWALGTREIEAWKVLQYGNFAMYGSALLFWGLN